MRRSFEKLVMEEKTFEQRKAEFRAKLMKAIDDKEALNECIRNGGNIDEVARERGIRFA